MVAPRRPTNPLLDGIFASSPTRILFHLSRSRHLYSPPPPPPLLLAAALVGELRHMAMAATSRAPSTLAPASFSAAGGSRRRRRCPNPRVRVGVGVRCSLDSNVSDMAVNGEGFLGFVFSGRFFLLRCHSALPLEILERFWYMDRTKETQILEPWILVALN